MENKKDNIVKNTATETCAYTQSSVNPLKNCHAFFYSSRKPLSDPRWR